MSIVKVRLTRSDSEPLILTNLMEILCEPSLISVESQVKDQSCGLLSVSSNECAFSHSSEFTLYMRWLGSIPCAVPLKLTVSDNTEPDEGDPNETIILPILPQRISLETNSPTPDALTSITTFCSLSSIQSSLIKTSKYQDSISPPAVLQSSNTTSSKSSRY